MKTLPISDSLSLPLDVVTMRTAIFGASGAGKTAFARLVAERVHAAGQRFCAIDLKNDWWGLKSAADGASAGIPVVIFGGPRADVQIFDDAGGLVAETVSAIEQSVVLDLDAFSKNKQLRFLTAFLERLYDVNRKPLLLIADEADRYAPQRPMSTEANFSLGAAEDICRRGRKRGIGSMWLTQRTAVLNKNVSDICDLTVVFRTPGARDLKELQERVERVADRAQVAEVMRLAPGLADGAAILLSSHPSLRTCLPAGARPIQLPLPQTFDSSATPRVGQATRRREPQVLAQSDLAAIEARMAEQVQRAKADDPRELRQRIAALERELKTARSAPAPTVEIREVNVIDAGEAARFTEHVAEMQRTAGALFTLGESIAAALKTAQPSDPQRPRVFPVHNAKGARVATAIAHPPTPPRPVSRTPGEGSSLPLGERRILTAVAQYTPTGGASREQLTVLTGYKRSSRDTYLQRLRERGCIEIAGDVILATDVGMAALGGDFEPLPTGLVLREYWLERLPQGERTVLEAVLAADGASVSREQISERTGYKRSSRDTYLQRLNSRQLVICDRGDVRASGQLFD